MLRPYINGAAVVDIFSGTGALGFEAISNGAAFAYFLDVSHGEYIAKNAAKLKLDGSAYRFIKGDFLKGLYALEALNVKADIIFADPPYNRGFIRKLLDAGALSSILNDGGLLVAEIHYQEKMEIEARLNGWVILKEKEYGETWVVLFKKPEVI
jgi:16S rRNA (guanine(966)-N(2))-methyltransferase RsmD